jgi:hypothetical protein
MSQFTAPLLVTPLDDGQSWVIVTDDFSYDIGAEGSGDTVLVPQWMITDFASVPRVVWWFAAPWGKHGHAAVVHDAGYYLQLRSRAKYDSIFLEAMTVLEVNRFKRLAMYWAVRCFGAHAWRANAKRTEKDPRWKIIDPATIGMPSTTTPAELHDRSAAPSVNDALASVQVQKEAAQ